ncbi:hypothetical protein [Vagococcus sp. WN89Y]|uniref:hypothetical protein n=1 Tax=Vagococcus sp. WN89Y TaxID=3457258 RepID=UPI003FCDC720
MLKKELSLFRAVKENPMLASIANIGAQTSQTARLHALGMAVTVVSNMGDSGVAKEKADILCDKNPRNPSADIYFDGAINKRGQDFIQGFVNNETPLDSTIYATGLKMGTEVKQLDPFMAQRFDALWRIRLNQISQAPDKE